MRYLVGGKLHRGKPSLSLPAPVEGKQYVPVLMSQQTSITGEAKWTEVDFEHSKADGIYTNDQSACAVVALIKRDPDTGEPQKVWMIHLGGGFSVDEVPQLPAELEGQDYELLVKAGFSESDYGVQCIEEGMDELLQRFETKPSEHHLFSSNDNIGGACQSLMITRSGAVGTCDGFESVLFMKNNKAVKPPKSSKPALDDEKAHFESMIASMEEKYQPLLRVKFSEIVSAFKIPKQSEKAAEALKGLREYLSAEPGKSRLKSYSKKFGAAKKTCLEIIDSLAGTKGFEHQEPLGIIPKTPKAKPPTSAPASAHDFNPKASK